MSLKIVSFKLNGTLSTAWACSYPSLFSIPFYSPKQWLKHPIYSNLPPSHNSFNTSYLLLHRQNGSHHVENPSISHQTLPLLLSFSQSCPTLFNPMNGSVPGFPVLHHLPELAQTHVHWVGDATQPSCPLSGGWLPSNLSPFSSWPFYTYLYLLFLSQKVQNLSSCLWKRNSPEF